MHFVFHAQLKQQILDPWVNHFPANWIEYYKAVWMQATNEETSTSDTYVLSEIIKFMLSVSDVVAPYFH